MPLLCGVPTEASPPMPSDRIRQGNQRQPARPLGFRTSSEPPPPSILIATRGPVKGHDICIFNKPPKQRITVDRPLCGLEVDDLDAETVQAAQEVGLAFIAFRPERARADAFANAEIDFVLRLDGRLPERDEVRMMAALRPILVTLPEPELPLSLMDVLRARRVAVMLDAPFAVQVPADISSGDLQVLRDSGLAAVILDPATPEEVADLRERIIALPEPNRRRNSADIRASVPAPAFDEEDVED